MHCSSSIVSCLSVGVIVPDLYLLLLNIRAQGIDRIGDVFRGLVARRKLTPAEAKRRLGLVTGSTALEGGFLLFVCLSCVAVCIARHHSEVSNARGQGCAVRRL
jgi:hypothetical protein